MHRLLYVSESTAEPSKKDLMIEQLVAQAQVKNAQINVTGALIFTGSHFAQVLEGPSETLHILMASINNDRRHTNVVLVDKFPVPSRLFPSWDMAYQGPNQFVSRHVTKLLDATSKSDRRRAGEWITELALGFSTYRASSKYLN